MAWRCCKAHTCDDEGAQCKCDMTSLDGLITSMKGKFEGFGAMDRVAVKFKQDLAPMDDDNGEKQVKSRSMNQYDHVMI